MASSFAFVYVGREMLDLATMKKMARLMQVRRHVVELVPSFDIDGYEFAVARKGQRPDYAAVRVGGAPKFLLFSTSHQAREFVREHPGGVVDGGLNPFVDNLAWSSGESQAA